MFDRGSNGIHTRHPAIRWRAHRDCKGCMRVDRRPFLERSNRVTAEGQWLVIATITVAEWNASKARWCHCLLRRPLPNLMRTKARFSPRLFWMCT